MCSKFLGEVSVVSSKGLSSANCQLTASGGSTLAVLNCANINVVLVNYL